MSIASVREAMVVGGWALLDALPVQRAPISGALHASGSRSQARVDRARLRVFSEILLTLGAILGLVVGALTLAAGHTGIRPLVVRSGSMEPRIPTGAMILVRMVDGAELRVGDIVTVHRPDGSRVTHRLVAIEAARGGYKLTTKGDANKEADAGPITVRRAERLVWRMSGVGRTAAWLATARGGFALGCIATVLVYHMSGRRRRPPGGRSPNRRAPHGMRSPGRRAMVALAVVVVLPVGVRRALAALTDPGVTAVSTFSSAADWTAPAASATVGAKSVGYLTGSVKQGGAYYIYANVSDTGAPASGVSSVTANVSNITSGSTSIALSSGSFSAGGVSYGYRSAALTASNPLSAGSKSWTLAMADAAGNSASTAGSAVTVDNTPPAGGDVQTANKTGGTAGRAETGDSITFTFSEAIDPESVLTGWTVGSADVVVRLIDGGCLLNILVPLCSDDSLQVWNSANSAAVPLGTVDLNDSDYHGGGLIGTAPVLTFGASGTASTMVRSGATITITFGTASASADTAAANTTMGWAPASGPYDAAANVLNTAGVSEGGSGDPEF